MADRLKEWQVPSAMAPEDRKIGFLNESVEEGNAWLRSQRGFGDYRKAMDVISGRNDNLEKVQYRSQLNTNRLKRNIREVVGALANIRPLWGYHSDNAAFEGNAEMMNKVTRALYLEQFYDRSLKEALQYAAATCTGWVRPCYRRGMGGKGKGNITLMTYGSPCVVPVQMPSNNDWQEAYSVTLLDEMPIYMAHSMFPDHQDRLTPTSSKYWYSQEIRKSAQGNMWKRMFGGFGSRAGGDSSLSDLYVPIRYTYVLDLSINTTDQMIPMGEPGSPWYYEVPFYGQMVKDGINTQGEALFRKANENDARMYPYRRLLISSESCVTYDGPAFDWHGELPLIPFCVDDWPWEAVGFSLVHDGYEIDQAINEIERGIMDKIRAQMDLPLGYDINAVTKKEAMQFDPMQPRARIGYDGSQVDKAFAPVVPPEVYRVEPEAMAFLEHLQNAEDYQLAVKDVVALAKARAFSKGDELESLMEAQGPIVRDISRSMERSLGKIGQQMKFLTLQYMDTGRLMQYVGADGVTQEIFDYDPTSLVPSHLPGEITTDINERAIPSPTSKLQRARWFADNLRFFLMPHSVHEITQMTYRLMLIQMRRSNMPIDSRTIAEACDIGNFGTKPEGNTVYERFWNEKEDELQHMVRIQKMAQGLGIEPDALSAGAGNPQAQGRPPSGKKAPHIVSKDGGTRSSIAES